MGEKVVYRYIYLPEATGVIDKEKLTDENLRAIISRLENSNSNLINEFSNIVVDKCKRVKEFLESNSEFKNKSNLSKRIRKKKFDSEIASYIETLFVKQSLECEGIKNKQIIRGIILSALNDLILRYLGNQDTLENSDSIGGSKEEVVINYELPIENIKEKVKELEGSVETAKKLISDLKHSIWQTGAPNHDIIEKLEREIDRVYQEILNVKSDYEMFKTDILKILNLL